MDDASVSIEETAGWEILELLAKRTDDPFVVFRTLQSVAVYLLMRIGNAFRAEDYERLCVSVRILFQDLPGEAQRVQEREHKPSAEPSEAEAEPSAEPSEAEAEPILEHTVSAWARTPEDVPALAHVVQFLYENTGNITAALRVLSSAAASCLHHCKEERPDQYPDTLQEARELFDLDKSMEALEKALAVKKESAN